jgi:hypothetical protein
MPPGVFHLAVGVVAEAAEEPILNLAIKGRAAEGWYPLSEIEVAD